MDRERPGAAGRRTDDPRRRLDGDRSRRAGTRVPADPGRTAGGLRLASLPRAPTGRDRRAARDPGRHRPIAPPLRNPGPPGRSHRRHAARPRGRSVGMSDDRRLDRAARSWLESGPTKALDHAIKSALLEIQSTPQERDWHVPWRTPTMNLRNAIATA